MSSKRRSDTPPFSSTWLCALSRPKPIASTEAPLMMSITATMRSLRRAFRCKACSIESLASRMRWCSVIGSGVLDHDVGECDGLVARLQRKLCADLPGNRAITRGNGRVRMRYHRGRARIGLLADGNVERPRTQQLDAVLRRHAP